MSIKKADNTKVLSAFILAVHNLRWACFVLGSVEHTKVLENITIFAKRLGRVEHSNIRAADC